MCQEEAAPEGHQVNPVCARPHIYMYAASHQVGISL